MGTDSAALRLLLDRHVLSDVAGHTHRELPAVCAEIGLPVPPEEGTKRERLDASLAALPDAELPAVARNALTRLQLPPDKRNKLEDVLWAGEGALPVPKRVRREIARDLDPEDFVRAGGRLWELLDRL